MALCAVPAYRPICALDPARALSQYVHDRWNARNGFTFGEIFAISQSGDGYLWIGTAQGLVRFDGSSFKFFDRPVPGSPALGPVRSMVRDHDGSLWIAGDGPQLVRYRDGKFDDAFQSAGAVPFTVTSIFAVPGGVLLWAGSETAWCFCSGSLRRVGDGTPAPGVVLAQARTRDGRTWVGTSAFGLFQMDESRFVPAAGDGEIKINALSPSVTGGLWIGTDNGLLLRNGTAVTPAGLPGWIRQLQILTLSEDSSANLWAGTDRGLLRVSPGAAHVAALLEPQRHNEVNAVYVDPDGELWFGGASGLERLSDGIFRTWSAPEGVPAEIDGPIYVDADGVTWFAPRSGGLDWLHNGRAGRVSAAGLDQDVIYSISGGGGEIWLGRQRGGLTRLTANGAAFTARTWTAADGLPQNNIYSVLRTRDGTVWAGTVSGGIARLEHDVVTTYSVAQGLPSTTVNSIAEDPRGVLWVATPEGAASFSAGHFLKLPGSDNLPASDVLSLFADPQGVLWIATGNGLAFYSSGVLHLLQNAPEPLREQIVGMTEDASGHLWLVTSTQILSVSREALLANHASENDVRAYGFEDGLAATGGVNRDRSIARDAAGNIWISLTHALAEADPAFTPADSDPLEVRIESLSIPGHAFAAGPSVIDVPANTQSIGFDFGTAALTNPQHVLYRYKLDGADQDWSAPVASRQVTYRNLDPGTYRFRVLASRDNQLWNGPESGVSFVIEPAFWNTWWFRSLLVLAATLAVLAFHRLRTYQLARQLNARFQERLRERTRIAQELHDTLLQGFLSASMQVDLAEDRTPEHSPAKPLLRRALQLMSQVTEEGRNTLRGLRTPNAATSGLDAAFSQLGRELVAEGRTEFRVVADGDPRRLRLSIRDEVYRIGREAIVNSFRHARATLIQVETEYTGNHFTLIVRDDGIGIEPAILHNGRKDHWGLSGMRERAESIGATLKLRTRTGAGTEVELTIPGPIAFARSDSGEQSKHPVWSSLFGRRKAAHIAQEDFHEGSEDDQDTQR